MAALPERVADSPTVQAIYRAYEDKAAAEECRGYLGASIIGHSCGRYLWYVFRWCGRISFEGRVLRLFETGQLEEARLVGNLRSIGCEVHDVDPATGQQFEVHACGGHFRGHLDGAAIGVLEAPNTWHVLEFKTHNAASFAELRSKGVTKAKPQHYCQVMVYMHLSGMRRALYVAVNKDADELYSELIRYDSQEAEMLMERATSIIEAKVPPARLSDDPEHQVCRWCDYREQCHGDQLPDVTCRSCPYAVPETDPNSRAARWRCTKHKTTLAVRHQEQACDDHLFIPGLINFAEPVDLGPLGPEVPEADWVEYEHRDGHTFRNGRSYYFSRELALLPAAHVGKGTVDKIKRQLSGTEVVEVRRP